MDRPDWIDRAQQVDSLRLDIGFLISEGLFYGPESGFSREQWVQLREPLYQPLCKLSGRYLLSAELNGSAGELLKYYQDVIRLAARYGMSVEQQAPCFWMRPLISDPARDAEIRFPWYDTREESSNVLDALEDRNEGMVFDDGDQGWDFELFAESDRFYLRESCLDTGEDRMVVVTSRAALADQVPVVRQRVDELLEQMEAALGRDYWSRGFHYPDIYGRR